VGFLGRFFYNNPGNNCPKRKNAKKWTNNWELKYGTNNSELKYAANNCSCDITQCTTVDHQYPSRIAF